MLLDDYLPVFSFRELHSTVLRCTPGRAMDALKRMTSSDLPLAVILLRLRTLPALLFSRNKFIMTAHQPVVEVITRWGFILLGEEPNHEIAFGIVGQFWKPSSGLCPAITTPSAFAGFSEPGWAKAAWNFSLEPHPEGTLLRTETRIQPTSRSAEIKFRIYWTFVRPGSGLIRRVILRAARRIAEAS